MTLNEAITALYAWQSKMSAYEHAMALIYYDGATVAPKGTAHNRAHALSILSEETYKLSTSEETLSMLEFLDAHKDELCAKDARIVEIALRDIKEMQKIPMDEYIAYQELLVEADDVWHKAKEQSDFDMFCPIL